MIPLLPLEKLLDARKYYERNGFVYVDSPWVVPKNVINITRPSAVSVIRQAAFVASGEQSFLDMILKGDLAPGCWQTLTPCYRPSDKGKNDGIHFTQFYKLELMWYKGSEKPQHELVEVLTKIVLNYLSLYDLRCRVVPVADEPRDGCVTEQAFDIEVQVRDESWIEFGSYGIRFNEQIGYWLYGTGLAEPRFHFLLKNAHE